MSATQTELQYIYETLRKLKAVPGHETTTLLVQQFPTVFLLKLLDERLIELQGLAARLVSQVFKRLLSAPKDAAPPPPGPELDQFFYHALYHLHNFFLELDWHQPNFGDHLTASDQQYASSRLPQINNFLLFQRALDESNVRYRLQGSAKQDSRQLVSPSESITQQVSTLKSSPKSSLSLTSKLDSPGRKRRVRFTPDSLGPVKAQETSDRELRESHSVTALDLILYAINLLVQCLCQQLNDWYKSKSNLKLSLELLINSKQKIRTQQLNVMARDIKRSNGVFVGVLGCVSQVFSVYLNKQVAGVLYGGATENWRLRAYAQRRIQVFSQKAVFEVERKVLGQLASQCLQVMLDLIVSEINQPPVELRASLGNKSREQVERSRENFLNFLTGWLRLEPASSEVAPEEELAPPTQHSAQQSTLATGVPAGFKSSSRILNQMSNLEHLMAIQLWSLTEDLNGSPRQLAYLLQLMHHGLSAAFDSVSGQLQEQVASCSSGAAVVEPAAGQRHIDSLNRSVDSIAAKVRHLKCVHIFGSLDRLIGDISARYGVEEQQVSQLHSKLKTFAAATSSSQQ